VNARRSRTLRALGTLAVTLCAATASGSPPADPYAGCRQQFAKNADDYDAAYCFYEVTFQQRLWTEGAQIFDELIARHPQNFWLPLAYGHVYRGRDLDRAVALYRRSAESFRKAGHAEGEILARSNLRNVLFPRGRVEEATRETERVREIGASVADPLLKARAWTVEATHLQETGGDLGLAYRLLKQTEAALFPNGPYRLKRSNLMQLGLASVRLGQFDEALHTFEKLQSLAAAAGEGLVQANAQFNILNISVEREASLPTASGPRKVLELARRTLETAISAQNREVTLRTHLIIAELLATEPGSRAEAIHHADACLEIAVRIRQPQDEAMCAWTKASLLRETAPAKSTAAERQALAATARANSPRTQAYSAGRRMRFSWETNPRPQAIRDSLAAIDAIETLRSLQDSSDSTADLFSTWTSDYYWLSGRLLQESHSDDRDLAFSMTERMRARSLLDALERNRSPAEKDHAAAKHQRALLEQIATVQRRLMDPAMPQRERQTTLQTLEGLERQEQEARRQVTIAFPNHAPAGPSFVTRATVQTTLAKDEAMLSFQVGLWKTYDGAFGGGSWLTVVTRDAVTVHRLPDRAALAPIVPVFTGLIEREDGLDRASAVRLYDDLLREGLSALPPLITRLIVVPDGPLHHLPFDALRSGRDAAPLAARYELVVAPSATLWHHWRSHGSRPATRRALAFADPDLAISLRSDARERNATLHQGLRVGRLPHARRESRALERHFGTVEALVGAGASEMALKQRNLLNYDILHFAAHAISDDAHPDRSAVLLAAGTDSEDGLLQAREIAGLDLQDRIVVLSACQTATGAVLSGEGVLSLARAFFEAGARSVIGSRWPIRDDDAAAFFDHFYRALAEGASLSEALTRAKAEAIADGRPAAAWASLMLLGDGDFRPFPDARPATTSAHWPLAAAGLAFLVLAGLAVSRVARQSPPPSRVS
jgi:CHAT domain-containing protein/tetratricopeptide (TPR) repeat protein